MMGGFTLTTPFNAGLFPDGISVSPVGTGTRGDFVSLDANNGSLCLSQNEQVARLTCGSSGCFGPPPPPSSTPEPASFGLLGATLMGEP
jgi:hypothetical protein